MVYSVIFFLFGLAACHKDTTQPNQSNHPGSEYFPNTVGDYWEYDVYDSSYVRDHPNYPKQYTVKVRIIGSKKLVDGKDAIIWQYQYPWGNDTNYVRVIGDTIEIFDLIYSRYIEDLNFPRLIFIQPFGVNKRWDGKLLYMDSSRVISQSDVTMKFQVFNNCFDIYHYYLGPNLEFKDDYWFKPNIGFVKIYYHQYNMGPTLIQMWQLKEYILK